ncbi:hypothetical protein QJS66_06805 [Kocuria rhizophila]|nr:hypothetical protein QJS66_06805 [Kocuria rhizophila]
MRTTSAAGAGATARRPGRTGASTGATTPRHHPHLDRATRTPRRRRSGSTGPSARRRSTSSGAAQPTRPGGGVTHAPFDVLALAAGAGHLELLAQ